ncbi:hypothetical protein DRH14_03365 [Candidatus Shapirobacteria bacterium]|nr:MAG: hypothetical protein DRH14_03365 [Candidatus Shapirobacteria bacterium]
MIRRNFVRKKENFVCEVCGFETIGDGYTDHCPKCLWGKHVDENIPGDRKSDCKGLMEPIMVIYDKGKFRIFYKCVECGKEFWVRAGKDDNRDELLRLGC